MTINCKPGTLSNQGPAASGKHCLYASSPRPVFPGFVRSRTRRRNQQSVNAQPEAQIKPLTNYRGNRGRLSDPDQWLRFLERRLQPWRLRAGQEHLERGDKRAARIRRRGRLFRCRRHLQLQPRLVWGAHRGFQRRGLFLAPFPNRRIPQQEVAGAQAVDHHAGGQLCHGQRCSSRPHLLPGELPTTFRSPGLWKRGFTSISVIPGRCSRQQALWR